jgi:ribonuclease-3
LASSRIRQADIGRSLKARARWAESRLGYRFADPALLTQALTHRSVSQSQNNERLEFLGDAFLNYAIGRSLYERDAVAPEGDLSRQRASLVSRTTLAALGRELDLEGQLIMGPGETRTGGAARGSVLANAVEAVIGAVLIDGGTSAAEQLVAHLFGPRLLSLPEAADLKDAKTRLQEWLQARGQVLPTYALDTVDGPPHHRSFRVSCAVPHASLVTVGQGPSRRRAEQAAAAAMLALLEASR